MKGTTDAVVVLLNKLEEKQKLYEKWKQVAISLREKIEEQESESRKLKKQIHYLKGRIEELLVDMNCLKRFVKKHRNSNKL